MPLVALLDTNVWVSAFLKPSGPPGQVVTAWSRDHFSAVTSISQLTELAEVRLMAARATLVETSGELKACRDPDDNEILEAAIRGKAMYLVTRDDDLKRDLDLIKMAQRNRVRVVSVRQFLRRLARQAKR